MAGAGSKLYPIAPQYGNNRFGGPSSIGRALQAKVVDHTRLNHLCVQGKQNELGVEIGPCRECGIDALLDILREWNAVGAGESLCTDHAIGDDLGGLARGRNARIIAALVIHEHAHGGEFHRLGHEIGVKVNRPQRPVEFAQSGRAAEPS